jgi:His-Xaa-Ser system protein HxsD
MIGYKIHNDCLIIEVDTTLFSDSVISRICYWLNPDYLIHRQTIRENMCTISFKPKMGVDSESTFDLLAEKVNNLFNDYKLREIIQMETKDIRNILYIKAFANNDDFEDYTIDS